MKSIILLLFFVSAQILFATTWYPTTHNCPVCGEENEFQSIGSYGSYIYQWPEKLELIFWPKTETYCMYTCSDCKYSAFMWDFNDLGGDTLSLVKSNIDSLDLDVDDYDDPMTKKLEAAEKIYNLYIRDPLFWCQFNRVKGYHYALEKDMQKADESRNKAFAIADSIAKLPEFENTKKELLLICASMCVFTGKKQLAEEYINRALEANYSVPGMSEEDTKKSNNYLNGILDELKKKNNM